MTEALLPSHAPVHASASDLETATLPSSSPLDALVRMLGLDEPGASQTPATRVSEPRPKRAKTSDAHQPAATAPTPKPTKQAVPTAKVQAVIAQIAKTLPTDRSNVNKDVTTSATANATTEVTTNAPTTGVPNAKVTPTSTEDGFASLGLVAPLLAAVRDLGFTQPTPVQAKAIPLAMAPREEGKNFVDLMVSSQTGSGKTAAYLLPVLQTLHADLLSRQQQEAQAQQNMPPGQRRKPHWRKHPTHPAQVKPARPGALVLCPTRELAQQVARDAIDLVRHIRGMRVATVIGGLPYGQQIVRLHDASLVVATPGRLLDLQRNRQIHCEDVKFLVVDEADRMLDLGFADDLAEINQLTAQRHQTMMFSATFEPRIQHLAARVMREPQRITIDTPQERHANIGQSLYWADNAQHKRKLLDHLMRDTTIEQAIVFASTQIECDGLAADLADAGFAAVALHGALSQGLRNRRLGMLRDGHVQFLVATDVAARGIDVPSISHVFNFGLPMKTEDYVHRIGRTGRAGRNGVAQTIVEHRDWRKIRDIEHYTRQALEAAVVPGLEPTPPRRDVPTRKQRDQARAQRRGGPAHAGFRPGAQRQDPRDGGHGGYGGQGGYDAGRGHGHGGGANGGGGRGFDRQRPR